MAPPPPHSPARTHTLKHAHTTRIYCVDIEPTERTCGALLNCYAKARDAASARKVGGARPTLRLWRACASHACASALALSETVLPGMGPARCAPPPVLQVFDSMASLGIRANLEIYTSLINACVQAGGGQWTQVGRVARRRCQLDAGGRSRLPCATLAAICRRPCQSRIMPCCVLPCSCTHACGLVPSPLLPLQLAFDLFDQMRADGLAPNAVTYGCLLAACERAGEVDLGFELYKQACDEVGPHSAAFGQVEAATAVSPALRHGVLLCRHAFLPLCPLDARNACTRPTPHPPVHALLCAGRGAQRPDARHAHRHVHRGQPAGGGC